MSEQLTLAEIRRRTQEERTAFDHLMATLSPAELETPGVADTWTVKDVLVHIIWWEQFMVSRISKAVGYEQNGPPTPEFDDIVPGSDGWTDAINERVYDYYKDQPFSDVLQQAKMSFNSVTSLLDHIHEDLLQKDSTVSQQIGFPTTDLIVANTFEHYEEHRIAIEQWSARQAL